MGRQPRREPPRPIVIVVAMSIWIRVPIASSLKGIVLGAGLGRTQIVSWPGAWRRTGPGAGCSERQSAVAAQVQPKGFGGLRHGLRQSEDAVSLPRLQPPLYDDSRSEPSRCLLEPRMMLLRKHYEDAQGVL